MEESGSPEATADRLFVESNVSVAILSPLTRGLVPNPQMAAAIAHATNSWVVDRWFESPHAKGRFVSTIRISVTNVGAALTEIELWADDPRFVAIAVPLRAFLPYGDDFYFPIWTAAVELNMPIFIFDDNAATVEHPETPVGPLMYLAEKHTLRPMASVVHLSSLITSGVFDRLPDLRVVVGDGGVDVARPMFWRIDRDWRQGRVEIPWVERLPSLYLLDHIRFVSQPEDGTVDGETLDDDLVRISDAEHLVLYGSHFPFWNFLPAETALGGLSRLARERIFSGNALEVVPRLAFHMAAL